MRERLGKYELVSVMSVGGMAELYLAVMPGLGGFQKVVALKQVLREFREDPRFMEGFLDEARITATLAHPHIVQVFDLGEADGELYLAMEFIAGVDLARLGFIAGTAQLPAGFVARVGRDVALALAYAHTLADPVSGEPTALIHRDITPRNVMVTFDGVVKVVDFGLARFRGRRARTAVGQVRGTPQYMALEQLEDRPLDGRTDLYGLGVVLWELLTGRYLAEGAVEEFAARLQRGERAPRVREFAPGVPQGLDDVVAKCLETEPDDRFSSGRELARALDRCGVELFDEGQLAEVAGARLPETRQSLRRLVALAQQPDAVDEEIKQELKTLRKADPAARGLAQSKQAGGDAPLEGGEVKARPAQSSMTRAAPPAPWQYGVVLAGLALLLLVGWFLLREGAPTGQAPDPMTADAQWRARRALNAGDPLHARAILRGCVGPRGPCPGLEDVSLEADAALAKSACGTEAQARAVLAEVAALSEDEAKARLRGCLAGKVLHPLAAQALNQLEMVRP